MPTVPISLYARFAPGGPFAQNRLLLSQYDGSAPPRYVAPANAGDTLACSIYFLDDGSGGIPFRNHRYPGATVQLNLTAFGSGGHTYAIANSTTEIAPASGAPTVTRTTAGSAHSVGEVQRVQFASAPFTGRFTLTFPGPTVIGAPSGVVGPKGTTVPIDPRDGIAGIQAAIRALPFYVVYNATLFEVNHEQWSVRLTVTGTVTDFSVRYQPTIFDTSQGAGPLDLLTINAADIQYGFGYSLNLLCTAADFLNLFLPSNAPAYLNLLITLPGSSTELAGQQLLVTSTPNTAPIAAFTAAPLAGGPGTTVQFTDNSQNSPTSWLWNFGDGTTSTSRNPSHVYLNSGVYNVSLTATNAFGSNTHIEPDYIRIDQSLVVPPGGGDNCGGSISINPDNPTLPCNKFDGDFSIANQEDAATREMLQDHPGLEVWRQTYDQAMGSFVRVAIGDAGGIGGYVAGDTPWESLGGNIVRWTRMSHNIPPGRQRRCRATKTYIGVVRNYVNGVLVDLSLESYTAEIAAICYYYYAMQDPGGQPKLPSLQVVPIVGGPVNSPNQTQSKFLDDFLTGFPRDATGAFTSNLAPCYITGRIYRVIGELWCKETIIG